MLTILNKIKKYIPKDKYQERERRVMVKDGYLYYTDKHFLIKKSIGNLLNDGIYQFTDGLIKIEDGIFTPIENLNLYPIEKFHHLHEISKDGNFLIEMSYLVYHISKKGFLFFITDLSKIKDFFNNEDLDIYLNPEGEIILLVKKDTNISTFKNLLDIPEFLLIRVVKMS